jgi:ketopantoate reductase
MKVIYIIGAGGRTGAMFCRELRGAAKIVGVGMAREIEAIAAGKIKIRRGDDSAENFVVAMIAPENFATVIEKNPPDFIWLAVRNPVGEAVKFYYRHFQGKDKIPALILSQNGLSAIGDAKAALAEVMGHDANKVEIIRVSLINGIDFKTEVAAATKAMASQSGTSVIGYKLPIKLGFGAEKKSDCVDELAKIFKASGFKAQRFSGRAVLDMENSKLFVNLIGMASATNGLSVNAVLRDKIVFEEVILKEEIAALKEFVLVVKKSGHGFLDDFCGYPIAMLAKMVLLPAGLLLPFRFIFEKIVNKGRNRTKNTSEIDYYNGEVVRMGKRFGVATPVNENIIAKAKKINRERGCG